MALKVNGVTVVDDNKAASLFSVEALGSATKLAAKFVNIKEKINVITGAIPSGVVPIDVTTASIWRYTGGSTGNWIINIRGSSTSTLNSLMDAGESIAISVMVPQGATAYYNTAVQIDGSLASIWWAGAVPTAGYPNSLNIYSYVVEKASNGVFQVYASLSKFAG